MKHVNKSVLLWYSARQMYTLVTSVTDYPRFLPWCERAEVIEQHDDGITARLHLSYAGVRQSFTTRNRHVPDSSLTMSLVDGPFSALEGHWRFIPIAPQGQPADPASGACRIEFELSYAFSNRALEAVVSPVFDRIANTFVEAFVKRAEAVHGAR